MARIFSYPLRGAKSVANVYRFPRSDAAETVIPGMVLDPRRANLVANGDFQAGLSSWATDGGTRTITDGVLRLTSPGGINPNNYQYIPTIPGQQYDWSIDKVAHSAAGIFNVSFVGATGQVSVYSATNGTATGRLTATGYSVLLIKNIGGSTAGEWVEFDNISMSLYIDNDVYKGAAGVASRYLGAQTESQLYLGAKSLWP